MVKRCSKCNIEKELTQFQTYFHSTQQKTRTRGECTECHYKIRNEKRRLKRANSKLIQEPIPTEIVQPVVPELQPDPIQTNPEYKQCATCLEYKVLNDFYLTATKKKTRFRNCKSCIRKRERELRSIKRGEDMELSHGSLMVPQIPGTYFDEYQRKSTFEFLTILGWSYDEDTKIWYKSGIKNSDGSWVNVTETKTLRKSYITKKRKSFTSETLPKLKTQSKKITEELLNQIMYEYFIEGIDLGNLSRKYGYDAQMLGYYTKKILQVEVYFDNYGNIYNK